MTDLDKRIRAFSTKRRYVEKLTVADVLAAMEPRPKPPAIAICENKQRPQLRALRGTSLGCRQLILQLPSNRVGKIESDEAGQNSIGAPVKEEARPAAAAPSVAPVQQVPATKGPVVRELSSE